ncbi:effector protein [Thermogymnomonas acidicola]|uniref:Elongation factor 1-beta n=1 Tax=Thermogymnomonas acidicola TaxID=399579 RepID=A0AA37F9J3_9ARCH|nr:elongation factor 1-beta [Thermogymnomonas acidicola]GGM73544.1 effector protein [Thermogymnomonas acidicola]
MVVLGEVLATFKVLPEDVSTDLKGIEESLRSSLKGVCDINRIETEDIGFGLRALRVEVIVDDSEGKIDSVERILSSTKGVGQVDSEGVSLI